MHVETCPASFGVRFWVQIRLTIDDFRPDPQQFSGPPQLGRDPVVGWPKVFPDQPGPEIPCKSVRAPMLGTGGFWAESLERFPGLLSSAEHGEAPVSHQSQQLTVARGV